MFPTLFSGNLRLTSILDCPYYNLVLLLHDCAVCGEVCDNNLSRINTWPPCYPSGMATPVTLAASGCPPSHVSIVLLGDSSIDNGGPGFAARGL
jgi:Ni,Fe-hydrogenase III small subunit